MPGKSAGVHPGAEVYGEIVIIDTGTPAAAAYFKRSMMPEFFRCIQALLNNCLIQAGCIHYRGSKNMMEVRGMRRFFPRTAIVQACSLMLLSVIIGLTANRMNPRGVAVTKMRPVAMAADDSVFVHELSAVRFGREGGRPTLTGEAATTKIIDTRQLLGLLQKRMAVTIDARSEEEFRSGHIAEAVNLPYERYFEFQPLLETLPRDRWIVTYCDGPPCDLSHLLAQELFSAGFTLVAIYEEGLDAWGKINPIVKGEEQALYLPKK